MSKEPLPAPRDAAGRIALLVDADNISHAKIGAIVGALSRYGVANVRRAYGDWTNATLKGWKDKLHLFAIRPMQQFSYSVGKNATDMALVIDAMELLYTQDLDAFCIASSDADFTPLVMQLQANGRTVHGFGERKTPQPFVAACTSFLYLDSLADPEEPSPAEIEIAAAKPASGADRKVEPTTAAENRRKLTCDTRLMTALRGAVQANAREDGWAPLSGTGSAVQRQASIDPRNFGVKGFRDLFEKTGLFELVKAENGHLFIADKRNKARAARPAA